MNIVEIISSGVFFWLKISNIRFMFIFMNIICLLRSYRRSWKQKTVWRIAMCPFQIRGTPEGVPRNPKHQRDMLNTTNQNWILAENIFQIFGTKKKNDLRQQIINYFLMIKNVTVSFHHQRLRF